MDQLDDSLAWRILPLRQASRLLCMFYSSHEIQLLKTALLGQLQRLLSALTWLWLRNPADPEQAKCFSTSTGYAQFGSPTSADVLLIDSFAAIEVESACTALERVGG
ncbi:hypothetical_protein (plasmid) [Leishmania braziliensis MHOM/BR/75/M2904]|uniref:Hypothetical_protein n=1 Tax=Leishmania braziliensis MHOM/BR/75/M2904 TaxID=420245 RepID=A0A3P3Z7E0_LEIBR|nr:unnamed protein product [Leishmania braziliensis]SYZ66158.1 hypothetical_protein [Leishmania braziliensis MHOM/BR/75/M2904]